MTIRGGRGLIAAIALVVLGMWALPAASFAAEGDLDSTYLGDGFASTDFGALEDVSDATLDSQGRLLIAGFSTAPGHAEMAVFRFNTDGTADTSFGQDGVALSNFGAGAGAHAVAVDSQGRIVVAGSAPVNGSGGWGVARFLANGKLDSSFGNGGMVGTDFSPVDDEPTSMAIDDNGRIVVGGYESFNGSRTSVVVRYRLDGSLDNSFDGDGELMFDSEAGGSEIRDLKIDSQNRIVATGVGESSGNVFVTRRLVDGTPDGGFGTDGITALFVGDVPNLAFASQGAILVAGESGGGQLTLEKLRADGTPDPAFGGGDGIAQTAFAPQLYVSANFAVDAQQRVVLGVTNTDQDVALTRLLPDGSPDTGFGTGGLVTTPELGSQSLVSVLVDSHQRILASGTNSPPGPFARDVFRARFIGDETAPTVTITDGPADAGSTKDTTPTFRFSADEPGVKFECAVDGGVYEQCDHADHQTLYELDDAQHTFHVRATDAAGNVADATSRTFVVDTIPPDPTITGKSVFKSKKQRVRAKFTIDGGDPDAIVSCRIDGGPYKGCLGVYHTPKLDRGRHRLKVRAYDLALNVGTTVKKFSIRKK